MRITRVTTTASTPTEMNSLDESRNSKVNEGQTCTDRTPVSTLYADTTEKSPTQPSSGGTRRRLSSSATLPTDPFNIEPIARQIRTFVANRHKRRLVQKTGDCNVTNRNVTKRKRKYLVDIFTTLVDMKWRYHLLMFAAAFILTWCFFGLIWYIIAIVHNDHLEVNINNDTFQSCVDHVTDYTTALLFSIETQTTIGYGYRVIQSECGFAIFVLMMQSCIGLFIQSLITGIIFSKISRPKGRSQTIMFSQKAVICKRDGQYYLLFRVGDMRKSHIIGTSIRALLVKNRLTSEGESIPLCQYPLAIETETSRSDSFVFLIWPVTVVHKIDEASPLWDTSLEKLMSEHFEIIVLLEGTIESTGMSTQVRTSYIPMEIMWGERLVPLLTFQLHNGRYEIDYGQFHNTTPMVMPECSAKEYTERQRLGTLDEVLQKDSDYMVSFTAPAVRPVSNASRSLHNFLQRRKVESGSGGAGTGGGGSGSKLKKHHMDDVKRRTWGDGHPAQINRAYSQDAELSKRIHESEEGSGVTCKEVPTRNASSEGVKIVFTPDDFLPKLDQTESQQKLPLENVFRSRDLINGTGLTLQDNGAISDSTL